MRKLLTGAIGFFCLFCNAQTIQATLLKTQRVVINPSATISFEKGTVIEVLRADEISEQLQVRCNGRVFIVKMDETDFHQKLDLLRQKQKVEPDTKESSTPESSENIKASTSLQNTKAPAVLELKGIQKEPVVTLSGKSQVYAVNCNYVIPAGAELNIEAGASLVFEKTAGITVLGKLNVAGLKNAPVIFRAKSEARQWEGIQIRNQGTAILNNSVFSHAKTAVNCASSTLTIEDSIITENENGVWIEAKSQAEIKNSLIANNSKEGLWIRYSKASLWNCSFTGNGEWGINSDYYPKLDITDCRITKNKGGICVRGYPEIEVKIANSVIMQNKICDVDNQTTAFLVLAGNYWGPVITAKLKTQGETAKFDKIKGQVLLKDFLEDEPFVGTTSQTPERVTVKTETTKVMVKAEKKGSAFSGNSLQLVKIDPADVSVGCFTLKKGDDIGVMNGRPLRDSIFAHAPSRLTYTIGDYKMKTIEGTVGIVNVRPPSACEFVIYSDGQELWRSKKIIPDQRNPNWSTTERFKINIEGVETLVLVVDDLGSRDSDHSCWINPVLRR